MENTENKAVVEEVVEQTTDQPTDEVKKDDAPKPKKPKKLVKENSDDVDFKEGEERVSTFVFIGRNLDKD